MPLTAVNAAVNAVAVGSAAEYGDAVCVADVCCCCRCSVCRYCGNQSVCPVICGVVAANALAAGEGAAYADALV